MEAMPMSAAVPKILSEVTVRSEPRTSRRLTTAMVSSEAMSDGESEGLQALAATMKSSVGSRLFCEARPARVSIRLNRNADTATIAMAMATERVGESERLQRRS